MPPVTRSMISDGKSSTNYRNEKDIDKRINENELVLNCQAEWRKKIQE